MNGRMTGAPLAKAAGALQAEIIDGQRFDLSLEQIRGRVDAFGADVAVIATAPSYLFWRCAPPELRIPAEFLRPLLEAPAARLEIEAPLV